MAQLRSTNITGDLSINNNPVADFIVEQGTSGSWTYRKWNSGIAECWLSKAITATMTSAWGNVYVSNNFSETYPFTFKKVPIETATITNVSGEYTAQAWWGISSTANQSTTTSALYKLMRPSSVSDTRHYRLNLYVVGQWK